MSVPSSASPIDHSSLNSVSNSPGSSVGRLSKDKLEEAVKTDSDATRNMVAAFGGATIFVAFTTGIGALLGTCGFGFGALVGAGIGLAIGLLIVGSLAGSIGANTSISSSARSEIDPEMAPQGYQFEDTENEEAGAPAPSLGISATRLSAAEGERIEQRLLDIEKELQNLLAKLRAQGG